MKDLHDQPCLPPKPPLLASINSDNGYISNIEQIRAAEYPALEDSTYLDHAGTTLYAKSLIDRYSKDLLDNLYGNPHSASSSSQLSSRRIDDVRLQVLRFFNADPAEFDVVFVANATAAIKLVGEAFRDHEAGFKYYYHGEAHTSVIGLREVASQGRICFSSDSEVDVWLRGLEAAPPETDQTPSLFAYPAQSNMTGRRLPLAWAGTINHVQQEVGHSTFTLLDAAALVSTAPLDLSNASAAPDFIALSFYKIFGFPDLGALIVRKSSGDILRRRKYFGGGTVESVTMFEEAWHAKKESSLHSCLEDGTLPFHSIIALRSALEVHSRIYGSMQNISNHVKFLASMLRDQLYNLSHRNGSKVCSVYTADFSRDASQGPVIAFNLKDSQGKYISNSEFEKLGIVKNIQFRTGGLCNPGGVASHLGLSTEEMQQNYAAGQRCGGENDIINGKPTGVIRVSLGAMSSVRDVTTFIRFIREFYVDTKSSMLQTPQLHPTHHSLAFPPRKFLVESLSVFPIKSCAAYKVPSSEAWEVGPKGLAWDREWCLVHEGTNVALSQKRYPQMALIQPEIDLQRRVLKVSFLSNEPRSLPLEISLDSNPPKSIHINPCEATTNMSSKVCGEDVDVHAYTSPEVAGFFTHVLGVPCTLARFPRDGAMRQAQVRRPGKEHGKQATEIGKSIALANESPILLVSRSSVNRLNENIKQNGGVGKTVAADAFRGNIVIAEELHGDQKESPYIEDEWAGLQIGDNSDSVFEILGPCQRCQMVCVDQANAQRRQEPFSTLSKTRRKEGRVWFGMHMCLISGDSADAAQNTTSIRVGDRITPQIRV